MMDKRGYTGTHTHREGDHVKMEKEIEVMHLQPKECKDYWELPEAKKKKKKKKPAKILP
jgi:hypothetical protein